jgi:hypothetical protein
VFRHKGIPMTRSDPFRRPDSVPFAAGLQLLTALPFLLSIFVVWRYGADAQAAAEAELTRQGVPTSVLADHGIRFGSNTAEIPIPAAIILVLVVLALLNLAGNRVGRTLSWIFHVILVVAGTVIIPGQVFTTSVLESSFRSSGDAVLQRIDVPALVGAADRIMPGWLPYVDGAKLVLTTLGSVLVIVLLTVPSTGRYVRARVADRRASTASSH